MDLAGSRCARCGRAWTPPRPRCPACAGEVAPTRVAATGTLVAWTVVRAPPAGREAGYAVGVVELPETRVLAAAEGATLPEAGARVVVREADGRLVFRSV